jgi:hypothetical protein
MMPAVNLDLSIRGSKAKATPQLAEAEKKPKVKGGQQFPCCSFTPTKPSFTAPTQGLKCIIFDYTGTAKVASTFNLNIKA